VLAGCIIDSLANLFVLPLKSANRCFGLRGEALPGTQWKKKWLSDTQVLIGNASRRAFMQTLPKCPIEIT